MDIEKLKECVRSDAYVLLRSFMEQVLCFVKDETFVPNIDQNIFNYSKIKFLMCGDGYCDSNFKKCKNMYKELHKLMVEKFKEYLKNINFKLTDNSISNTQFLIALSKKDRDIRKNCFVCLTESELGKVCKCGYSDIVVFRPCGHSICANPCFYKFCESKDIQLIPTIVYTKTGPSLKLPSELDISTVKDFACPLCRINVTCVFRAKNTIIDLKSVVTLEYLTTNIKFVYNIS